MVVGGGPESIAFQKMIPPVTVAEMSTTRVIFGIAITASVLPSIDPLPATESVWLSYCICSLLTARLVICEVAHSV